MAAVVRVIGEEQLEEVEAFYEEKREEDLEARASDRFYNYRCFQNWVKGVLIREGLRLAREGLPRGAPAALSVLDLGCGKGGDLHKLASSGIDSYVGVDVSLEQLRDGLRRKTRSRMPFPATFVRASAFAPPEEFRAKLPDVQFNFVSVQFCLHYFFGDADSVRCFLRNATAQLARGGVLVATFPDARVIAAHLRPGFDRGEDPVVAENGAFSLMMEAAEARKEGLGQRYGFFLDGLIGRKSSAGAESVIQYVPEYIVPLDQLVEMAAQFGLRLEEALNFHEFYAKYIADDRYFEMFRRKGFADEGRDELMPDEHWQTSYLYQTAVFRMIEGEDFNPHQTLPPKFYFKLVP